MLICFSSQSFAHIPENSDSDEAYQHPINSPILSIDGNESTESITFFSETLQNDVLHYPDLFGIETPDNPYYMNYFSDWENGSLSDFVTVDSSVTGGYRSTELQLYVKTKNAGLYSVGKADVSIYGYTNSTGVKEIRIYNNTLLNYQAVQSFSGGSYEWQNFTVTNPEYFGTNNEISLKIRFATGGSVSEAFFDYIGVNYYYMTLADAEHYAEGFSDVSDWAIQTGNTPTSDDDVGSFHVNGDNAWDYYYTNVPAITNMNGYYIEVRFSANESGSLLRIYGFALDDHAGTSYALDGNANLFPTTSWQTKRFPISHDVALESIRFHMKAPSSDTEVKFDYLRISPADEMGWQHDGSTVEGVTNDAESGFTYSTSSDGDILGCNITRTSGSGSTFVEVRFLFDTTTTVCDIERDYYPFWAINAKVSRSSSASSLMYFSVGSDSYWSTLETSISELSSYTTLRLNHKASTSSNANEFARIGGYLDATDDWLYIQTDWCMAYSIANYTYSASGVGTDDYLYVDSNILYSSVDSGTIELDYDPALSVSDTYSVYNLTTSGTAPEFSMYVSSWSTYSDDTRGATSSGTITDIKLRFDGTEDLSEIKFIEDGTSPVVVRSNANPVTPDDSEAVTLSAVVTDAIEVWTVKYNAIVYPSGFSDVDYSANEQSDNLWTYTFSAGTLNEGYYCFLISASDGANTNTATEYAYVDFTVGEVAITQFNLTLWQVNILDYHINIDWATAWGNSTLQAYDNDSLQATGTDEDATLIFAKSSVVGVHVLDFKISSGTNTIWKNNTQYEIAQDQIVLSNSFYGEDGDSWAFSATVNQNVNYYVYDNDTLKESGTKTTGFFAISRDFVNTIGKHIVSIKFNTSLDSEWAGGSYDVDSTLSIDSIGTDQNNETVTVGFRVVRSAASSLTYTAYEAGLVRATGIISINEGDFFSCAFDKSYVNIEGNATVVFSDGTSSVNVTVIYIIIDQADEVTNVNTTGGSTTINPPVSESMRIDNFRVITTDDTDVYALGSVNYDCSYIAYQNGEQAGTGDVLEGSFSIKLSYLDGEVNVTIIFSANGQNDIIVSADYGIVVEDTVTGLVTTISVSAIIIVFLVALLMDKRYRAELVKAHRQGKR
jgi:hypothetical protein